MTIPAALRTPFRDALTKHGVRAVSFIRRKRLVTHLVGVDLRSLCRTPRPTGTVSDMTMYTTEKQVCGNCLRAFHSILIAGGAS